MWRRKRRRGGGEKREFYARSTILAGEFHMSTPLMSVRNFGETRRQAEAGVRFEMRGILSSFVEYLSHSTLLFG